MTSTPAATSPGALSLQRPSKHAETISVRYLCRDKVRISWRNVETPAALIAVRARLINAVFFFRLESSVP